MSQKKGRAGKAEAEQRRLARERAEAERWRAQMERRRRNEHTRERKKRRAAERRQQREWLAAQEQENAAALARINLDDRRHRPGAPDPLLVGQARVTGTTAVAVGRRTAMTRYQWAELEARRGGA